MVKLPEWLYFALVFNVVATISLGVALMSGQPLLIWIAFFYSFTTSVVFIWSLLDGTIE